MLDSIIFEKLGVPAAAIVTKPFVATCNALAELQSMPGYRFVQVEHPITSLTLDQLRSRARQAAPYVEALLVDGVPWPVDAHQGTVRPGDKPTEPDGALDALIEDLAAGLRADGADLTGSYLDARTVRLVLHIPDQACAECIMPATHLIPIFEMRAAEHLGPGVQIELDDPRLQH